MKKITATALFIVMVLALFTGCSQQSPAYIDPIFPSVEYVNSLVDSLGEVNDIKSAALVSKIIEEYQFLDDVSKSKINDIQRIFDSIEVATTFLTENDITLKVMSFNIRYGEFTEDRIERVINLILKEEPDVIGLQEVTDQWRKILKARLSDKYEFLGHGRNEDLSGEGSCVLHKKDSFKLIDSRTLWLTDTPEVWSKHPESSHARILTFQLLERKSDGQIFLHVNTHLDHIGEEARIAQAQMITSWINDTFSKQYPTVITGDFNCLANTTEYQTIIDADYRVTNTFGENVRTYQGYNDNGGSIIDFCFVNDLFPIVSYKVCEEKTDGEWISDHNAIVSELILLPTYDSIDIPTEENAQ